MRLILCLLLVTALSASKAFGQEQVDTTMASRIRTEATERSRVMDMAFYLSDVYGPRLTGSPGFRASGEWAVEELRRMGLKNVHLESIAWGRGWKEEGFSLRLVEPGSAPLIAVAVPWSISTNGPVEGDVLLAPLPGMGDMREAYERFYDAYGGKLRGRFVLAMEPRKRDPEQKTGRKTDEELQESFEKWEARSRQEDPAEFEAFMEQYREMMRLQPELNRFLEQEGVVGVLYQSRGYGGTVRTGGGPWWRTQSAEGRAFDYPLPPASAVLAWEHYNRLVRLVQRGLPVRLRMDLKAQIHDDPGAAFNIIGEIPGSTKPDELVLIGAHFDSWVAGTGATDNAAGSAVVMEAMRILSALDVRPGRTIRLALWGGHEGAGLGSRTYARERLSAGYPLTELEESTGQVEVRPKSEHGKVSAYYNLDHGPGRIRGIYLQGNEANRAIFQTWFKPFADHGLFHLVNTVPGGTDNDTFHALGIPGFQFVQDGNDHAVWTHHSNMDLYDYLNEDDLKKSAMILAFFAFQTANRDELMPRASRGAD